ncbi:MAG: GyrI-like domain-containing protein [Rhodospirillaceae bacterium]
MKAPIRKPVIVDFPTTCVIGLQRRFPRSGLVDIGLLWTALRVRAGEIVNPTGTEAFGIHQAIEEPKATIEHMAGVEVAYLSAVPDGMVGREIGGGKAAFFLLQLSGGPIGQEIGAAFETIWRDWMPDPGYRPAVDYDIERYGYRFNPQTLRGMIDLVVPIEPKK